MGFFKSLFGNRDQDLSGPTRTLDHPRDLQVGDIVKFGFAAQNGISNETFQVTEVSAYDLGGTAKKKTLFTLKGRDGLFRLAVVQERGTESLQVARSVLPDTVEQIFDIEQFAFLFDEASGMNNVLERIGEPDEVAGWTAPAYRQEAGHQAYVHQGDYRHRSLSTVADDGEAFDYYLLVSDDRKFALQAEVYEGGRTDVYLIAYLPITKIEELWQSGQNPTA